jgi:hypothetical protein
MAKPGMRVGLDTDAAAGRNGPMTDERRTDDIETFVTHDSVADIVARSNQDANCGS